jgi:hypothetical protein
MYKKFPRPVSQPHDSSERRLRVAMRMSQLASSRALIFIVGIVCGLFGGISLVLERQALEQRVQAEAELTQAGAPTESALTQLSAVSHDEQMLYAVIAGYGLLCLVLAKYLYHVPMMAPVLGLMGFVAAFIGFWKFNHSDSPVLYITSFLLILGALILAVRAGHQFRLSYARMGRPHEK